MCWWYINGNDITLKDRIIDIYPYNISFSPSFCDLQNADIENKRFECLCNISFINNNEIQEYNQNDNFITYLLDMINYKIFVCPNIIAKSNINDYLYNIGFILCLIVILFNIICSFIFYLYFLTRLRIKIYKYCPNIRKMNNKLINKFFINSKSLSIILIIFI